MSTVEVSDTTWPFEGLDINHTLLPLLLAHCFNWCLFGLLCLQTYTYYASFPRDARHFKVLVYGVFVLDAVSIALATYSAYVIFVQHWGDVNIFHQLGWSWASVPLSTGLVSFIVQSFFAYRIWIISQNWVMAVFIVLLSGISAGFAGASAAEVARLQTLSYIRRRIPSIWLSFGISADFFICATLVFYLLRVPNNFKPTRRVIVRLVRISIETAMVTIVAATVKLILIFTRHDLMHILICLLLPRLYTNAMVGTLNIRSPLFGGGETFQGSSMGSGNRATWGSPPPSAGVNSGNSHTYAKRSLRFAPGKMDDSMNTSRYSDHPEDGQDVYFAPVSSGFPLSPMSPPSTALSKTTMDPLLSPALLSPPAEARRKDPPPF